MGIEHREYYRDYGDSEFFGGIGSAVKGLLAANIAVFLLQIFTIRGGESAAVTWLAFDANAILHGQVWRLITWGFGFDGGGPLGFIFDMLFLYWFGRSLESMYGSREFALYYLISILFCSLVCLGAGFATGSAGGVVGASAPVMAVTVLYAIHFPRHKILLFFLIPVEIWMLVAAYVVINLVSLSGTGFAASMFTALLAAVAFAFLYHYGQIRFENLTPGRLPKLSMPRQKPALKVFDPSDRATFDQEVDEILTKISEQGEASLTSRERKKLKEASKRYRKT